MAGSRIWSTAWRPRPAWCKPGTPVISTVHPMQLLDEDLPWTQHDVPLDIVVTTESVIRCGGANEELPRPKGIYWEDLQ